MANGVPSDSVTCPHCGGILIRLDGWGKHRIPITKLGGSDTVFYAHSDWADDALVGFKPCDAYLPHQLLFNRKGGEGRRLSVTPSSAIPHAYGDEAMAPN